MKHAQADNVEELVVRAQTGDQWAYEAIYDRFQQMALAYAYSILGDYDLAEDARQDAFVSAYCDLLTLREPAAFPGWLRQIVHKHSVELIRRRKTITVPLIDLPEIPSAAPTPADALERQRVS